MTRNMDHDPPDGSQGPGVVGQRTVLVADDDQSLRRRLATRLRATGYRVLEAESAFEFLEYLSDILADEKLSERPELIVCDMRMPGVSSLGSIASLRSAHAVPVIVLTSANTDIETSQRAERLGAAGVFVHPVDITAIVSFCTTVAPP